MTTRIPDSYGRWRRGPHWNYETRATDCSRCGGSGTYTTYHGRCFGCGGTGRRGTEKVLVFDVRVPADDRADIRAAEARRKELNRHAAQERKRERAASEAEANLAALEREYPGITEAFEADHHIVSDIRGRAARYGSISTKQAGLVFRLAREQAEYAERRAAEEARAAAAPDVPEGRYTLTGEVLTTKWQESRYGTTLKMLVLDDCGFKVWGSVPSHLDDLERGERIRFDATVERSDDDPKFGFFKRPTKAQRLDGEAVEAVEAPEPEPNINPWNETDLDELYENTGLPAVGHNK